MHKVLVVSAALVAMTLPTAAQQGGAWTCSAPNLVRGEYSGGSDAYIHLSGFQSGRRYPVQRQGRAATGVTGNGTRFTCRQR